MSSDTAQDVLSVLEEQDSRAHCPMDGCEWSIIADMKEGFLHHYYEHREFVEQFDRYVHEIASEDDIDVYFEDADFRMERMTEDGVWMAAYGYPIDDGEVDIHYKLMTGDDGLVAIRWVEVSPE